MIPSTIGYLEQDLEIREQPSRGYRMNLEERSIYGYVDGKEAMKQAVYRILNTERYQYIIYSWNYGIETMDLYGEPVSYVCPELERRITEALLADSRIESVSDFIFDVEQKGVVRVLFQAHTMFGDVQAEKEVKI